MFGLGVLPGPSGDDEIRRLDPPGGEKSGIGIGRLTGVDDGDLFALADSVDISSMGEVLLSLVLGKDGNVCAATSGN